MGSCMSSSSGDGGVAAQTPQRKSKTKAFQGKGNRLGSANDPPAQATTSRKSSKHGKNVDLPAKRVDSSLSESERDRQREARLAAAEKRQKANGGTASKKKKTNPSQPLRGPNSEPLMRWTA